MRPQFRRSMFPRIVRVPQKDETKTYTFRIRPIYAAYIVVGLVTASAYPDKLNAWNCFYVTAAWPGVWVAQTAHALHTIVRRNVWRDVDDQ